MLRPNSIVLACIALAAAAPARGAPPRADFETSVAPLLVRRCVSCHNASESNGGLDLTRKERAFAGGDSGAAIVAGAPDDSYLLERVTEGSMPPKGKGQRLSENEVAEVAAWIKAGANWPEGRVLSALELTTESRAGYDWWSLQPVKRPSIPDVKNHDWARNPIDLFVLRRLEERGVVPAPEVDRVTYIRRATFDLLGLPPTPDEIDDFVADKAPDAYERLVDRLLASPHYGERWGRHWLDVVRFGESDGFENDRLRPNSWPYRDYVIDSFNADKSYTDFIREQLAGDVLEPATRETIAGSGFLVAGPWDEVQNVAKSPTERLRAREEQIEELLATLSQAFLGLTVNCARCHDHKFDPVAQTDYYRLKAIFDGVDHGNRPLLTPDEQRAHESATAPLVARIEQLRATVADVKDALGESLADHIAADQFVEGRFGEGYRPRGPGLAVEARAAFNKSPLTVECWAKVNSKSSFNIFAASHSKESGEHWEVYTYAGSGELSAYLPGFEPAEIKSGVDVTDGGWHYLAFVFDSERVKLFVDAKLVKEVAVRRIRTGGPAGPLWLGAYPPQNIGCDGVIDEVRVSTVARPIERIPEGAFAPDEYTVGLWHFNKAEGARAKNAAMLAAGGGAAAEGKNESEADADKRALAKRLEELTAELKQYEAELAARAMPMVYAGTRKQPEPTVLFARGDITKPGAAVTPGTIAAIRTSAGDLGLPADAPEAARRRKFADWVANTDNPLTARVMVNRVWLYHFGQGLVETPSDFGFNGGRPSHPELLDWLATEFVEGDRSPKSEIPNPQSHSAWTLKRLHRLILLSATYRQSSRFNPQAAAFDADNRLLWRFAPRRLEAEIVRDTMLATSGDLNRELGGPSFRPFTVTALLTQFYHLIDDGRADFNRRTVYRIAVNTAKSPFLDALDCPAPSLTMPRRKSTTTTLQALALMNDAFVQRQAARFSERLVAGAGGDKAAQVRLAYRLAFGRPPTDAELSTTLQVIADHGLESLCWALFNASEFLYVR